MFAQKTILITGGTGSLGNKITETLTKRFPEIKKIIIYSRDEQKQFQMAQKFPSLEFPNIRFFIGDIRDKERLRRALYGVDYVIHTAALKHVPIAEYNPDECVKTNIFGAMNLIECAIECKVKKVVALSTDKACSPINLYGASKLASDKLFIAANHISGGNTIFSVVRYGNVIGSNGSVIPFFLKIKESGILPITDKRMTRFNISLEDGVQMVLHALENSWGGELYIPKLPSYKIMDVAKAVDEKSKIKIIGIRPGEKIHEEMISSSDSFNTYDLGNYYVILPQITNFDRNEYLKHFNGRKVEEGFSYNSGTNTEWVSVQELKDLIKKHIVQS